MEFNDLETVRFQNKMKPAALAIYRRLFPGCCVEDLREQGVKVHVLDKEFGIDSLIKFESGQWISIQEKYRRNYAIRYLDFTQEYMNAEGTEHESPGEWFKLAAQLYFYGWANASETDFEKWALLDVAKLKLIIERAGGLDVIGERQRNSKHGRASFYGIPMQKLQPAIVTHYKAKEFRVVHR